MTTRSQSRSCDEFQMAAMARLDGEPARLTDEEIAAHTANCNVCDAALAGFAALHAGMGRVSYDHPDVDLWPAIHECVAPASPHAPRDRAAIIGLAVALGAWRLAQLLIDLPAPVVNSIVPLVLVVVVIWRVMGDPFAIRVASHYLHGGRS